MTSDDIERTQTMSNPSAEERASDVCKKMRETLSQWNTGFPNLIAAALTEHAAAAVAEEREACAKTAENSPMDDADYIAADIRKRGKPT